MLLMSDFFSKYFKKEKKRKQLEENVAKGKLAEEMYETEANMNGVEYKRTGKGSDYEETHHDALTGKKKKQLVEVKSDDAELSKYQKKTKKKKKNYVVKRYNTSLFTGKAFSIENIFGDTSKKKSKKNKTKKRKSRHKKDDNSGGFW